MEVCTEPQLVLKGLPHIWDDARHLAALFLLSSAVLRSSGTTACGEVSVKNVGREPDTRKKKLSWEEKITQSKIERVGGESIDGGLSLDTTPWSVFQPAGGPFYSTHAHDFTILVQSYCAMEQVLSRAIRVDPKARPRRQHCR
ncbi:hypothetical protein EYF80_042906 [Liparis tanakae]|uniref:Uncharacterized protein n=1 Tax=Liparis tanakae TaxID=230148 RepID=A0A4Z2G158_9TELE|nr:hypothetical protein EYF80_042906 [Liparis tanakae]